MLVVKSNEEDQLGCGMEPHKKPCTAEFGFRWKDLEKGLEQIASSFRLMLS